MEDEPATATMHFRFGSIVGDVYLGDIRVVDLGTGQETLPTTDLDRGMEGFNRSWSVWPPAAQNTVGAVSVAPGKGHNGSAALHVALRRRRPATGPTSTSITTPISRSARDIGIA